MKIILGLVSVGLGFIILWRIQTMNTKLEAALAANNEGTARIVGKLGSIKTFIQGVPALVAAAVADALAQHDVEEAAAADTINQAEATAEAAVDDALSAIDANPAPEDTGGSVVDAPVEEAPPAEEQPTE
jgi:hypothetical protein